MTQTAFSMRYSRIRPPPEGKRRKRIGTAAWPASFEEAAHASAPKHIDLSKGGVMGREHASGKGGCPHTSPKGGCLAGVSLPTAATRNSSRF